MPGLFAGLGQSVTPASTAVPEKTAEEQPA